MLNFQSKFWTDKQTDNRKTIHPHLSTKYYPFTPQILILKHQPRTVFENIVGKGEIARTEQLLLFPQCFLLNQIIVSLFVHIFGIVSLFAAESEEPKFGIRGNGLTLP